MVVYSRSRAGSKETNGWTNIEDVSAPQLHNHLKEEEEEKKEAIDAPKVSEDIRASNEADVPPSEATNGLDQGNVVEATVERPGTAVLARRGSTQTALETIVTSEHVGAPVDEIEHANNSIDHHSNATNTTTTPSDSNQVDKHDNNLGNVQTTTDKEDQATTQPNDKADSNGQPLPEKDCAKPAVKIVVTNENADTSVDKDENGNNKTDNHEPTENTTSAQSDSNGNNKVQPTIENQEQVGDKAGTLVDKDKNGNDNTDDNPQSTQSDSNKIDNDHNNNIVQPTIENPEQVIQPNATQADANVQPSPVKEEGTKAAAEIVVTSEGADTSADKDKNGNHIDDHEQTTNTTSTQSNASNIVQSAMENPEKVTQPNDTAGANVQPILEKKTDAVKEAKSDADKINDSNDTERINQIKVEEPANSAGDGSMAKMEEAIKLDAMNVTNLNDASSSASVDQTSGPSTLVHDLSGAINNTTEAITSTNNLIIDNPTTTHTVGQEGQTNVVEESEELDTDKSSDIGAKEPTSDDANKTNEEEVISDKSSTPLDEENLENLAKGEENLENLAKGEENLEQQRPSWSRDGANIEADTLQLDPKALAGKDKESVASEQFKSAPAAESDLVVGKIGESKSAVQDKKEEEPAKIVHGHDPPIDDGQQARAFQWSADSATRAQGDPQLDWENRQSTGDVQYVMDAPDPSTRPPEKVLADPNLPDKRKEEYEKSRQSGVTAMADNQMMNDTLAAVSQSAEPIWPKQIYEENEQGKWIRLVFH